MSDELIAANIEGLNKSFICAVRDVAISDPVLAEGLFGVPGRACSKLAAMTLDDALELARSVKAPLCEAFGGAHPAWEYVRDEFVPGTSTSELGRRLTVLLSKGGGAGE